MILSSSRVRQNCSTPASLVEILRIPSRHPLRRKLHYPGTHNDDDDEVSTRPSASKYYLATSICVKRPTVSHKEPYIDPIELICQFQQTALHVRYAPSIRGANPPALVDVDDIQKAKNLCPDRASGSFILDLNELTILKVDVTV